MIDTAMEFATLVVAKGFDGHGSDLEREAHSSSAASWGN